MAQPEGSAPKGADKVGVPKDDHAFVQDARTKFDDAINVDRENRERGMEDALFVGDPEAQWPDAVKKARANRPCLTVNELPQYIRQVTGDVRINRPSIKVHPAEDGDVEVANVLEGLIRSIEDQSDATRVYVERIEDSARSNMGFMRVTTEYADDETFDLDLRVKGIQNPFSVVWDPSATDPTLRDARYMFVYDDMPIEDFRAAYPEAIEQGFDGVTTTDNTNSKAGSSAPGAWSNDETIRVCEYWMVLREEVTLCLLSDGRTVEKTDEAYPEGVTVIKERKAMRPRVCQYMITGSEVLSGPHEWPGDRIPIVPVWGEVYRIGGRKVRKSLITDSKDAMRMINYAHSAYVERTAMAPKAPWLVSSKMVAGLEDQWKTAATGNPAVLQFIPDPLVPGGPKRIEPAPVEAAWVQEMLLGREMLHATTGIYPAALGQKSNETSGKAINARQKEADVGAFVFTDNLIGGIREVGRILVNMIPKVYDAPRTVRVIGPMDEAGVAKLNQPGGADLTIGKYDISISTGPSFSTRRLESAESMTQFAQAMGPQGAILLAPMIAKNMDWPQAEEVAQLFKPLADAMMPPPPGTPPPPDPKAEAMAQQAQMQMQAEQQRMQFEGEKHQADMALKQMDAQSMQMQQRFEIEKMKLEIQKIETQAAAQREAAQQAKDNPPKKAA